MPKEKIYDACEMFDVEIGWHKERESVQLGIVTHSGVSLADWLAGQEDHVPPGHPQVHDPKQVSDLPQFNSLWATLDRAQINRLINRLRRARDEAYGKDE